MQNMIEYAISIADCNSSILEKEILSKYDLFREIYWTLQEYSEFIKKIKCNEEATEDSLEVEIIFKRGVDSKCVIESIAENMRAEQSISELKPGHYILITR